MNSNNDTWILLSPVIDVAWKSNILSNLNKELSSSQFWSPDDLTLILNVCLGEWKCGPPCCVLYTRLG